MGQSFYLFNIAFPDTVGMTTNIIWTTFVPDFRFVLIVVAAPPTSRIINVWLKIVIMCRIGCSHSSRAGQNNIVPGSTNKVLEGKKTGSRQDLGCNVINNKKRKK